MGTPDEARDGLEGLLWEVLEPRVEDVIDLDLNDPTDSAVFAIMVGQVLDALIEHGYRKQGPVTDAEVNAVALEYFGVSVIYDRERLRAALEVARGAPGV